MKKIFILLVGVALGITSCNSYLDINQDPNSPSEENMDASMIFPGAEMNLAASYGDFLRITGGYFAQQYGQNFGTSNYLDYSQFSMSATRSSSTYTQLTARCLRNLEIIRKLSVEGEDRGSYLAATVLRAFTYQALVDAYGETPYTEGLDIDNLTPKYDDGQTVYDGILAELDEALANVTPNTSVCTNFLFGNPLANDWIKFANALKLKLLMRMSDVKNVQSELAKLITEGNFPDKDVAWAGIWSSEKGKGNPFYQEEFATNFGSNQVNVMGNIAFVKTMQESRDARLEAFFSKNGKGEYTGNISGTNFSTTNSYKADYWCRPIMSYDSPVFLITKAEIEFFLAEYYARYGTSAEAESHYIAAIEASFATAKVKGAEVVYDGEYAWNNANYKKLIGIQKWIALGGTNNFEAWCELRRLKYPAIGSVTGSDLYNKATDAYSPQLYVPGTLYTPIDFNTSLGAGKVLQRFPYAESSANRNNNTPAPKGDATPVFWAQ